MAWGKPIYPPDATHRVTVRATADQIHNWSLGFRIFRKGTNTATFLAWAGDFAMAFLLAEESLWKQKQAREQEEQKQQEQRKVYDRV